MKTPCRPASISLPPRGSRACCVGRGPSATRAWWRAGQRRCPTRASRRSASAFIWSTTETKPALATAFAKAGAYHADTLRGIAPAFHAEVRFYKHHAPELGDLVPRCYFAEVHPDGLHFALLLEDLAPSRLMLLEADGSRTPDNLEMSLRGIAKIHATFWNRQRRGEDLKGLYCPYLDPNPAVAWFAHVRAEP